MSIAFCYINTKTHSNEEHIEMTFYKNMSLYGYFIFYHKQKTMKWRSKYNNHNYKKICQIGRVFLLKNVVYYRLVSCWVIISSLVTIGSSVDIVGFSDSSNTLPVNTSSSEYKTSSDDDVHQDRNHIQQNVIDTNRNFIEYYSTI